MDAIGRGLAVFCCVVFLTACQDDERDESVQSGGGSEAFSAAEASCAKNGGRWAHSPNKVTFVCYRDLSDAGNTCSAESDCQGVCLARSRTCSPIEPLFGCNEVLTNAGFAQTLCIE